MNGVLTKLMGWRSLVVIWSARHIEMCFHCLCVFVLFTINRPDDLVVPSNHTPSRFPRCEYYLGRMYENVFKHNNIERKQLLSAPSSVARRNSMLLIVDEGRKG